MARIIDILTFVGGKIVALGSDDRLQWSHATNTSDPFASLKRATLDPLSNHHWRPFDVGDVDIDELCQQYRHDAKARFGFLLRPKNPLPA